MHVIRRQIVFRPLTRRFFIVSCLFALASFPGAEFLCSGSARVLPWASAVFVAVLTLHAVVIIATILLSIFERPVTIRRDIPDPNYREHEL
jgi:hypothetical protein